MRLKQIALQGYKTFASKTTFSFEEGITAIVGPNGSGKSNIADALRWVLGEQSYSTLRGKRSTDMIFAGGLNRPRAGMAQAILTLDNSDNWLPIDYTEVEIGRRVYRSGENEYILNGQKVRLRDLQELLATSGLAERTYTIIGQGLIDQALSLRAEERRALFEEAAGISHYKARRAQTLRRLEETHHNLERIHDILSEINPRLNSLRRQANRARNYEQVLADLRHLLRIWYGFQWEKARRGLRQQRQVAHDAEAVWQESRRRLLDQQTHIDQLRRQVLQLQRQLNEKQAARERIREQGEQIRRRVAVLGERKNLLERQLAEAAPELPRLQQQQAEAQAALTEALAGLETAQASLAEQEQALLTFAAGYAGQQQEIDHWTQQVQQLNSQFRAAQNRLAQAEGQLSQLQERQREASPGRDHTDELAQLSEQITRLSAAADNAQARVDDLRRQRQELRRDQEQHNRQLKALRQSQGDNSRQLNQMNKEVAALEARRDLLDQMRHKEMPARPGTALIGRLAGLVTIPAMYRAAIEAALGARLGALVLGDEAALWQMVQARPGQQALVALVQNSIPTPPPLPPPPAGAIDWAANVVTAAADLQPLVRWLFGPILLVDQPRTAYQLAQTLPAGGIAAAHDGFLVHAGGLVEYNPENPQRSILAREEAWRQAQQALDSHKAAQAQAQAEADAQQQAVREQQTALDRLSQEESRLGRLEQEASQRLANAQRDLDRTRQQQGFIERQQSARAGEQARLAARVEETQTTLAQHQEQVAHLEAAAGHAQARLAALPVAEMAQQQQNWQQKIDTARTIVSGREAVVESRRATLNQIEGQLNRQRARLQDLQRQYAQLNLSQEQGEAQRLQASLEQLDQEQIPIQQRLSDQLDALARAEDETTGLQKRTHDQETHYTQAKIALSQQENHLDGLAERIRADLGLVALRYDEDQLGQTPLPIAEVVDQLPEVNELPDDIEDSIQRFRGQLHRMGAINPEAPAEYEETLERSEFLTRQVDDLQKTEAQLRTVIADLDQLTSQAFAQTVEQVNGIFDDMFSRLFGGGSARLVLTDPDDLTISGVDIIAQLPRRRQQGLGLLSGGERSLTAAALIFALLKVNPPPFCVLDEVDAMLDEANVTRFRDVLLELRERSQVIVITHNRGTVQAAQTVYGISMGSDSASQVISIKPEEYVNEHNR